MLLVLSWPMAFNSSCSISSRPKWLHHTELLPIWCLTYVIRLTYAIITTADSLWPLLLIWPNFNPGMDRLSHDRESVEWNCLSITQLQRFHRWSLGIDKSFHPTYYNGCDYLSMLGFGLIDVKQAPCPQLPASQNHCKNSFTYSHMIQQLKNCMR